MLGCRSTLKHITLILRRTGRQRGGPVEPAPEILKGRRGDVAGPDPNETEMKEEERIGERVGCTGSFSARQSRSGKSYLAHCTGA